MWAESHHRRLKRILAAAVALAVGVGEGHAEDTGSISVAIANCGTTVQVGAPPARAIAMNQGATEILLELGLESRIAGTAYLDDVSIYAPLAPIYASVPVIAKKYPSREVVLAAKPDLVYASYFSAFDGAAAGSRGSLAERGIASYLSPSDCKARSEPISFDDVFQEIREVGRIFAVPERAERVVLDLTRRLDDVRRQVAARGTAPSVLWLDGTGSAPRVGGSNGSPGLILRTAGTRNVFEEIPRAWGEGSWEQVLASDPDFIVLVDAAWDPASAKHAALAHEPLASLRAVRTHRYVTIPFASTTPSFRNLDAVEALVRAIEDVPR